MELEIFEDADNDATCSLDVREVKAKLDHPKLLTQFGIISQGDFHIELAEFRTLMEGDLPGDEDFNLRQVVNAMRSARLDQFPEEEDTRVADVFENQENDQRAEQEQKAKTDAAKLVSGTGWVPHRGLVLYGNRKYDEHGKRVEVDWSQPSLLMRVVQDFAVANSRATPAKLNWTKSAGDDAVFGPMRRSASTITTRQFRNAPPRYTGVPRSGWSWRGPGPGPVLNGCKSITCGPTFSPTTIWASGSPVSFSSARCSSARR